MISNCEKSKMCFWDKHEFEGEGVMCPIFYKPKQIVKKKREYYINENVENDSKIIDDIFKINKNEIFYDDKFCSVNCCLAWIEDNNTNPKYKNSKYILFKEIAKLDTKIPMKANHWKTLKIFGGFLDIEEFRKMSSRYKLEDSYFKNNVYNFKFKKIISM